MESLITRVYQLFDTNKQIFIDAGLQPVKCIDRFRGQTTHPEQFEIYPTPAIFIGWKINWQRNGKVYEGTAQIDFHVISDDPGATESIATNYDEGLKNTFFYKLVQQLLDDIESDNTTKLIRSTDNPVDTGVVCYNILSYTCKIYEQINSNIALLPNNVTVEIVGKKLVNKIN